MTTSGEDYLRACSSVATMDEKKKDEKHPRFGSVGSKFKTKLEFWNGSRAKNDALCFAITHFE